MKFFANRFILIASLFLFFTPPSSAQLSVKFDGVPFQNFSDPNPGLEDAKVATNSTTLGYAHSFALNPERTQLEIGLSWERREFSYRRFPDGSPDIDVLHGAELSFNLTHALSQKWSLLAMVTPGLASDLHGKLNSNDFNVQAVLAGIRRASPQWAYGVGVVYSTQFGDAIPLPVLLADWNNGGKLSWFTILPVSSELWYAKSDRFHMGMLFGVNGNKYQGDPNRYETDDPELQYTLVTVGPSARVALGERMMFQVEAGVVPYHRFEFFDGSKKVDSLSLESSAFMRVGIQLGM